MQLAAWMTRPAWFLVAGLPWPEDQADAEIAEAAFAIAPDVTHAVRPAGPDGQPVPLGHDLALMLDAGSRCAAALGTKVIFLSDITRWLADTELSWQRVGVSFGTAQSELERQPVGLYLELSQRAYTVLCSTARTLTIHYTTGGTAEIPPQERELLRAKFQAILDADWPACIERAMAVAQPAV